MMFSITKLKNSFKYAIKGLKYIFINEQNFKIQLLISIGVVIALILLKVEVWETIVLLMLITLVLVLEIFNTVLERIIDVLEPKIHSYVGAIKDLLAAAVLISSIGASIIALLIFIPYFLALF